MCITGSISGEFQHLGTISFITVFFFFAALNGGSNSLETEYITRYLGLKRKTNKIKLQKKTIEFKYSLHFTTFHVFLKFVKINVEKKYKYVISAKENWIKVDLDNGREC